MQVGSLERIGNQKQSLTRQVVKEGTPWNHKFYHQNDWLEQGNASSVAMKIGDQLAVYHLASRCLTRKYIHEKVIAANYEILVLAFHFLNESFVSQIM